MTPKRVSRGQPTPLLTILSTSGSLFIVATSAGNRSHRKQLEGSHFIDTSNKEQRGAVNAWNYCQKAE